MADDRDLPGIPNRNRIPTRPERKPTVRVAVPPPGAGNKEPPKRNLSPPPIDLSATLPEAVESAKEGLRLWADEAERRAQEAEERADRAEAALAREKRKSRPEVESVPPPSLPAKGGALIVTRGEVRIPTWMLGAAISALGLGSWQAWEQIKATPAKLEAAEKRVAALESRALAAEDTSSAQRAELVKQGEVNAAIRCQLRHVRAAFERSGVTLDALPRGGVDWRSEYLPDSRRVRTAPAWRAVDDCPELP